MSLIKDFENLNIGTKGIILNILSTVPFFFIIVYLFNKTLISKVEQTPFSDIDFYYIIAVCFSLALLWFLMNFLLAILSLDMIEWVEAQEEKIKQQKERENKELENSDIPQEPKESIIPKPKKSKDYDAKFWFFTTYMYSVGYLAIAMFINMWLGWEFKWFVFSCFGFVIFRLVWVAFWHWFLKKLSE
ncbi:MAG: hypothetical protein QE487_06745 [Fluviicola sp.]|nr:hypothetical protein [Fluviicola sp.]